MRTLWSRVIAAGAALLTLVLGVMAAIWATKKRENVIQENNEALSLSGQATTQLQTLEQRDKELLDSLEAVDAQRGQAERAAETMTHDELLERLRARGYVSTK